MQIACRRCCTRSVRCDRVKHRVAGIRSARLRLRHVRERLEVHAREARAARALDPSRQDLLPDAEPADLGEEVHLAEIARVLVTADQRRKPAAANDRSAGLLRRARAGLVRPFEVSERTRARPSASLVLARTQASPHAPASMVAAGGEGHTCPQWSLGRPRIGPPRCRRRPPGRCWGSRRRAPLAVGRSHVDQPVPERTRSDKPHGRVRSLHCRTRDREETIHWRVVVHRARRRTKVS